MLARISLLLEYRVNLAGNLELFGCCFVRLHLGHELFRPLGTY
jgi:hypothetical protein